MMMTSKDIRRSFLDYFRQEGHVIVEGASLIIHNDPTLLFTNAGMNPWKGIILGNEPIVHPRVADIQRCLRVSGKHNDLEEVGLDTYHHTLFEMMGNWSFGDYFKEDAIRFAWKYLTDVLHIDPRDIYVTVFEGSEEDNIPIDDESAAIWGQYMPKDHILYGNKHDNFWEMGDTGPCGPCSEIHVDCRKEDVRQSISGAELVNKNDPEVIEIWNLVFMEYNRLANGKLESLPRKIIDTGMGFERVVRVVQGKHSNYDTDIFRPMLEEITRITDANFFARFNRHLRYGDDAKVDVAMRVIADHIRTIVFAIADGQMPSNDKAGYVIRRILRRAVRFAYNFLEQHEPFLYKLVPELIRDMGEFYPYLIERESHITKIILAEETAFLRTLSKGLMLLDDIVLRAKSVNASQISGQDAFLLKDTYGFPIDLTELLLREKGMSIDMDGYHSALEEQRKRAREANKTSVDDWIENEEYKNKSPFFVGYHESQCVTHIIKYRQIEKRGVPLYQVVLTKTPFYAEMGGQVGDRGVITDARGNEYTVVDTQRENGVTIHLLEEIPDDITLSFTAKIDIECRRNIERNHSATHLLHYALRSIVGTHIEQKGSYVCDSYLRFDFSHFSKIGRDELRKVESAVNSMIRENIMLEEHLDVPIEQAKSSGAMALFSEKYGDHVRVIKFGPSIELCGGCHVVSSGMIGSFHITSESSIATGVRRIEAVTAQVADDLYYRQLDLIEDIRSLLGNAPNIVKALEKITEEKKQLEREVSSLLNRTCLYYRDQLLGKVEMRGHTQVIKVVGDENVELIKGVVVHLKASFMSQAFAFVAGVRHENKPSVFLYLSDVLVGQGKKANEIIQQASKFILGGGGGSASFATAGGKNVEGLSEAVDYIMTMIET